MSMFSQHWHIHHKEFGYWNGGKPGASDCWDRSASIRIKARKDAERIVARLFDNDPLIEIWEDE